MDPRLDVRAFCDHLTGMTADQLRDVARTIRSEFDSADGEVAWWRATVDIRCALRRQRRSRLASLAAHEATGAVRLSAERAGLEDRDAITLLARAASDVVRGMVAGESVAHQVRTLETPWDVVLALPA